MVFSNLSGQEKDAFFSLLDEYFTSRPDILGSISATNGSEGGSAAATAGNAVHKALANNPALTANLVSTGLKNVPKSSPYSSLASNPAVQSTAGRVAAASLAFSGRDQSKPSPPSIHARHSSNAEEESSASASGGTRNLVPIKKFGDVDTSSAKSMFTSLRHSTANKSATPPSVAPPIPAAFGIKRGGFAPPPSHGGSHTPAPEPELEPAFDPEQEEEPAGEWVEALYDYSSSEATDLEIKAGQRILVTEKSSADWWTGTVDGRSGLFPATYVKAL